MCGDLPRTAPPHQRCAWASPVWTTRVRISRTSVAQTWSRASGPGASQLGSRAAAHPDLAAVVEHPVADAGGAAVARAEHGHVRHVDGHVPVDDAAGLVHPGRLLVLLGGVDALDDDLALAGQGAQDRA